MSYSGLGITFGGKIGGSVSYENGDVRTSGSAEGSTEGTTRKTYKPVTDIRMTYRPPKTDKPSEVSPSRLDDQEFPWVWVGVGAGVLLLVGGIAYAATR